MATRLQIEFDYAARRMTTKKMVVVVMEEGMKDTSDWDGIIGADLGGLMYVRAWDDEKMDEAADTILERLWDMVDSLALRCESRKGARMAYLGVCTYVFRCCCLRNEVCDNRRQMQAVCGRLLRVPHTSKTSARQSGGRASLDP